MMANRAGLTLNKLSFTGSNAELAQIVFGDRLNVLYGASNTGKSFSTKAIDFMLGASRPLPDIDERQGYERAWLGLQLPKSGNVTLMRALAGGAFEFHEGDVYTPPEDGTNIRQLSARHDHTNTDNLSQLLLEELGFESTQIAIDPNGKKRSLSFRDLARYCIVDETSIQSETSPAESGQHLLVPAERSVFKLLVTGTDDGAIVPVVDRKTFKTSTAGKLEVIAEMIAAIDEELTADYPNAEQLPEQSRRLEGSWARAQHELQLAQQSIRARLVAKRNLAETISLLEARRAEIQINIARFEQLQEVYRSDIERLEAIEEAGFLLALGGEKDCPLCGASPEFQRINHGIGDIERAREAAGAEAEKIRRQGLDLNTTLEELGVEATAVAARLNECDAELTRIETELADLAPTAAVAKRRVEETQSVRDQVRKGLSLIEQRGSLQTRSEELAALKPATKADRPVLGISSAPAHEFAQKVSEVLTEWQFPGKRHVAFDEATYDLRIDGKLRRDNGKGVRAVTHAAFKVALLLHCRERNLPHPGFLVLDTPLLTYRDPLHSKAGPLAADETALRSTSLRDFFFAHLAANGDKGQFIVVENVDLPTGIETLASLETFTGDPSAGRAGLFHGH